MFFIVEPPITVEFEENQNDAGQGIQEVENGPLDLLYTIDPNGSLTSDKDKYNLKAGVKEYVDEEDARIISTIKS